MAKQKRPWEVWHNAGVIEHIDAYWRGSPDEMNHRKVLADIVKAELQAPTDSILEVGCGTGLVYAALGEAIGPALNYRGVDNSVHALHVATKYYPDVAWGKGDAFKLPYEDGAFDIACAFEVFGHLPDCATPIAELVRVAKRRAIFTVWITAGETFSQGTDHNEYPATLIASMLAKAMQDHPGYWTSADLGAVRAYIVRKR